MKSNLALQTEAHPYVDENLIELTDLEKFVFCDLIHMELAHHQLDELKERLDIQTLPLRRSHNAELVSHFCGIEFAQLGKSGSATVATQFRPESRYYGKDSLFQLRVKTKGFLCSQQPTDIRYDYFNRDGEIYISHDTHIVYPRRANPQISRIRKSKLYPHNTHCDSHEIKFLYHGFAGMEYVIHGTDNYGFEYTMMSNDRMHCPYSANKHRRTVNDNGTELYSFEDIAFLDINQNTQLILVWGQDKNHVQSIEMRKFDDDGNIVLRRIFKCPRQFSRNGVNFMVEPHCEELLYTYDSYFRPLRIDLSLIDAQTQERLGVLSSTTYTWHD